MKNAAKTEVDLTLVGPSIAVAFLFGAWVGIQGFPNGTPLAQAQRELASAQQTAVGAAEVERLRTEQESLQTKVDAAAAELVSRRAEASRIIGATVAPVWRIQVLNRVHQALQTAGVGVSLDADVDDVGRLNSEANRRERSRADASQVVWEWGPVASRSANGGQDQNFAQRYNLDNPRLLTSLRTALQDLSSAIGESTRAAGAPGQAGIDPMAFAEVPEGMPGGFGAARAAPQPAPLGLRLLALQATYGQMLETLAYLQRTPDETMAVGVYLMRPWEGRTPGEQLDWFLLLHIRAAPTGEPAPSPSPSRGPLPPFVPKKREPLESDGAVVVVPPQAFPQDGSNEPERAEDEAELASLERGPGGMKGSFWSPAFAKAVRYNGRLRKAPVVRIID